MEGMIHSPSKYRELDYWMQLLQEEDPGKLEVAKSNLRKAAHYLQKRAEVIDSGSFRVVFEGPNNTVIKLPTHLGGIIHNLYEIFSHEGYYYIYFPTAHTEFHELTEIFHIPIISMEKVDQFIDLEAALEDDENEWIQDIDGMQVGRNKEGKIVCFDFASNIMDLETHKFTKNPSMYGCGVLEILGY